MSTEERKLDQLRRMEEELKCIICSKLMDDPHSLMCGHNFCGVCLQQWFPTNKSCPTCRTPAIKQPVQNITLQKLVDILWPSNLKHDPKLQRADWLALYPVENQGPYITERDQDGVTYRCSNCAWELDEEFFCAQCLIQYDYDREAHPHRESESDSESYRGDHDTEGDLENFVVQDDQVDYEDVHDNLPEEEYDGDSPMEVNSSSDSNNSSDEEGDNDEPRYLKRRRIQIDDDEDDEDDDVKIIGNNRRTVIEESDGEEEEEEEEEEYSELEDPFPRNKFIMHSASEDEDEEDERPPPPPKMDRVLETISKAQRKMEKALRLSGSSLVKAQEAVKIEDSSESSGDDEPDYDF